MGQTTIKIEDDINADKDLKVNGVGYQLCAFVNHTTRRNHYTAHILHDNNNWYEYDDENVKPKSQRQALMEAKQGYYFLYQKVDIQHEPKKGKLIGKRGPKKSASK